MTARGLFSAKNMDTTIFQLEFAAVALLNPDIKVTPRMVLAQAVHESANFQSNVYKQHSNMFGMKAPKTRETTCTNKGGTGYADYRFDFDCIRDYFMWCRARGVTDDAALWLKIDTPSSKGGYAEDPQYSAKIANQIRSLEAGKKYIDFNLMKAGESAALAAAVAAAAWGTYELVNS